MFSEQLLSARHHCSHMGHSAAGDQKKKISTVSEFIIYRRRQKSKELIKMELRPLGHCLRGSSVLQGSAPRFLRVILLCTFPISVPMSRFKEMFLDHPISKPCPLHKPLSILSSSSTFPKPKHLLKTKDLFF